jgi:hypothetical protein
MGGPTGSIPWQMPLVGDVSTFSTGQKWAFAGIGAVVVTAVMWLLFYIVGSFL